MVTLENYRDFLRTVNINGVNIHFFVFNGDTMIQAQSIIDASRSLLAGLPPAHLGVVYPILFIADRLPSSGGGGGPPAASGVNTLIDRRGEDIGATPEAMRHLLANYASGRTPLTFHWIPRHVYDDAARAPNTVVHEAIHGVDMNLHLRTRRQVNREMATRLGIDVSMVRPFNSTDLPGHLPGQACGSGTEATRLAVNAYLSLLGGFRGVNTTARRQIVNSLKLSRAFENVPESWWTPHIR
jgi:hypothetical protein